MLEQVSGFVTIGFRDRLVEKRQTAHRQIDGVGISWALVQATLGFGVHQLDLKHVGEACDHFILEPEQVGHVFLEAVGPEMRAACGVDQLDVDAHPVGVALHRAFEDIAHAQFLADLLGVDALALEGEGSVAGDDEAVADTRQFGGEILGDAVVIGSIRSLRSVRSRARIRSSSAPVSRE